MKRRIFRAVIVALIAVAGVSVLVAQGAEPAARSAETVAAQAAPSGGDAVAIATVSAKAKSDMWKYISAAIAVGTACVGGGLAVGQIGSAAMGAMSEKPELSGKAIPFAGLAEGVCLWGFLVALIMILV